MTTVEENGLRAANTVMERTQEAFMKVFPADKVAKELAILAFSDMADYVGSDTGGDYVKALSDLSPKKKSKAIKKLKIKQLQPATTMADGQLLSRDTLQTEIELYDKLAAFRLAMDIMGWNAPQKLEHSGSVMIGAAISDEELLNIARRGSGRAIEAPAGAK